ncbi:Astacin-like metalloprotease toxin [Dinothrombium tinctorium]|uniref:Astacin-like metalloprotease toxin n=1 Tax=Dinothrombium tinctorium TaxID=1965070 RepID=A0A3S3PX67_9ACAR|nr:Astacin-like metalloprotease toxin [Dinothrombium tinctorium]
MLIKNFIMLTIILSSSTDLLSCFAYPNLFEDDILGINIDRNAVKSQKRLWPSGIVPFFIDHSAYSLRGYIFRAMRHIESKSCLRFRKRKDEKNFIVFVHGKR